MSARRRATVLRLLTMAGVLRVRVCPLCAGLVAADGEAQHAAVHTADARRAESGGGA